jgi:hypothetical protein
MLLALPDHALSAIARTLSLPFAVAVARTCHRLWLAFPRALGTASAAPVRLRARVTSVPQFSSLLEWMRVYDLTLVVRGKDIARLVGALSDPAGLAGLARWARLDISRLGDYAAVYRHMRRRGLVERIERMPKPRYFWGAPRNVDEWDAEDAEFDRMSWLNAHGRLRKKVVDTLVAQLGNLHSLDLTLTGVTDAGVAHLSGLHTLLLSHADVTDAGIAHLSGLHTLDLGFTRVTDKGVAHLSRLHTLLLRKTDVTDAGVAHLSGLHTLDLTLTRVTDKGVAHLSRLHTLLL